MFGIFLVMVVAVVGGLIAFVGDRVGMRVGRKRLTIFGLRPKYTSIAIAILTGVLTATSTLGILSAASENVRLAVFHLTQLRQDLETAQSRNLRLKVEYNRVDASLVEVTKKWRTDRTELDGINTRIAALTEARTRAEEGLAEARADLALTAADLSQVKGQYAKASTELAAANGEVKFLQQRKDNLESAIALLENQIESLSSQREYLGTGVVDFATQPLILHVGEVLVAGIAKPGKSFTELEGLVVEMLNRADRIARDRGAAIENKDVGTRVDIKRLSSAYKLLFDLKSPAVIRVVSGTNTIAGKPAFIYLEVLPDTVVFHKGESLASIELNGQYSTDEVFALLIGELLPEARTAAETKGMVNTYGGTPWPEVTYANLQDVVAKAVTDKAPKVLDLLAVRDLRRAGDNLSLSAALETK